MLKYLTKKDRIDMTRGSITGNIFFYAIPLIVGSLLQTFFNVADQVVLGQMAGGDAVASVASLANMILIVIGFFVGLGAGATVVLARSIGSNDEKRSKDVISTAMVSAVGIGIFASIIALPCVGLFLRATDCPSECLEGAKIYAYIYFLSVPAITVYNFGASVLQVTGDSARPMTYIILAGASNVVLNILLCLILENKVIAVAVATVVSQVLGVFLVVRRLTRLKEAYRLDLRSLTFDVGIFGKILRYGIPSGFNGSLFAISNVQVQKGINFYGAEAIAGHAASVNIESVVTAFMNGFGITAQTMVGQNLGAGKKDRVKKSIFYNMGYSMLIAAALCVLLYLFRRPLVELCVPDMPDAFSFAENRMRHVLLWCAVNAYNTVLLNVLNAFGYSAFTMIGNICSTILFRTFWMQIIYPRFTSFSTIMLCYTIAWWINAVLFSVAFAVVYTRFVKGKVKRL